MDTTLIRATIEAAVREDQRSGALANQLVRGAANAGSPIDETTARQLAAGLTAYVWHVPALIEATQEAASTAGVRDEVDRFLEKAAEYWNQPHDVFPDHQGVIGLVDDAFVFLSLIQQMSGNFQRNAGRPLIDTDLAAANANVRQLIGEPFATQLDFVVATILQAPAVDALIKILGGLAVNFPLHAPTPHPIWGNASTDEIVNARLGAMGIV